MGEATAVSLSELVQHTATIVAAQIGERPGKTEDLPALISLVFHSLSSLGQVSSPEAQQQTEAAVSAAPVDDGSAPALVPAVAPEDSIHPDHIICLEDGKKLRLLKRYLMTQYGLSPEEYRAKWGLPQDYPMIAPSLRERRQAAAKVSNLKNAKPAE